MARPRRREELVPDPPVAAPEITGFPDELEQAIAGLPQDSSTITLYRIPDQGKPRYITKLTPEEFDLEQVKRQFGGGRFRYVALQDGIKVQEGHFEIEGEPILGGSRREETAPPSYVARLEGALERIVERLETKPGSDLQEKLLTTLMAMVGKKDDGEDRFLEKLAAMRAAGLLHSGGGEGGGSHLLEAVKLVKEGMMLSGGGEGGPVNPFMYAIEKLTPSIEKAVDAVTASRPPEKPVEKPVPGPQVSESCKPFVPILRLYLPALITGASMNASAETWADTIEENVPPDQLALMRTWLQGDTWYKDLCILDRRIGLQAAWWTTLRSLLLEPPEGEEPGGVEEEPEPEAA